jgi:hypothetical protein
MNKARMIFLVLVMLTCVCAEEAAAQNAGGNPPNWCRNGLFPSEGTEFKLAQVTGIKGARIHFFSDTDGCPDAKAKCVMRSYLIPGDRVLISKRYGPWICSWYQPRKGSETVGWLPAESLVISSEQDARPPSEGWVGLWKYYDQSLNIRRDSKAGFLRVKGDAIWRGLGDNVHEGSVEGSARSQGNELTLVDGECRVSLRLVGDYIVASDNSQCGGANVRFDGVYRRGR